MRVLVTGASGFIARNLITVLQNNNAFEVVSYSHSESILSLENKVDQVDFIFHLAGVNRPIEEKEFSDGNSMFTKVLCDILRSKGKRVPLVYSSSSQASLDNKYGISKKYAEDHLIALSNETNCPLFLMRLPNVFGKWSRPNYNSVVATFCYNIAHSLPVQVHDESTSIKLLYIDDLIDAFLDILNGDLSNSGGGFIDVDPCYQITLGELAQQLYRFHSSRDNLITEPVGTGLTRALYSTYLSFLPPEKFNYEIPSYGDERGVFVEMLKTNDSGQFSYFTAHPGVTRGGHYHHSKNEKFLVVKGEALFRFKHIITEETYELKISDKKLQVVETIPGWCHDITNAGETEMFVLLWANEIFDRNKPDTIVCEMRKNLVRE